MHKKKYTGFFILSLCILFDILSLLRVDSIYTSLLVKNHLNHYTKEMEQNAGFHKYLTLIIAINLITAILESHFYTNLVLS